MSRASSGSKAARPDPRPRRRPRLGEGSAARAANRSGVVALEPDGTIVAAGWTVGLDETEAWIAGHAGERDALLLVDAPLVVANATGQRLADTQVGQRYGRWWVSANSVNLASAHRAGLRLRERLEQRGWRYHAGVHGHSAGRVLAECYPYTTIVGAPELGYAERRPPYKRVKQPAAQAWPIRTAACDELIRRVGDLRDADPPMDLASHPVTRRLLDEPSPARPTAYKQREDLLDAAICAWTGALWLRHGLERCQVLGVGDPLVDDGGRSATIIAPARPEQRR